MHQTLSKLTDRIRERSRESRSAYLERCRRAADAGPARVHLTCGNLAHVTAAVGPDKEAIADGSSGNIGIITAYNDMLSAHQPFGRFPDLD